MVFVFKVVPVSSLCGLCFQCPCITAFSARLKNSVVCFPYKYCIYLTCDYMILTIFLFGKGKGLLKASWNSCVAGTEHIEGSCKDVQEENVLPWPWKNKGMCLQV